MAFTTFLVIFASFSSLVLSNPVNVKNGKKPFTIKEATGALSGWSVDSFSGNWISDNELEYQDKDLSLKVLNVVTNVTTISLDGSILKKYRTSKYKFSPDRNFVLIPYNETSVFRHTKNSRYVVYSVQERVYYDVAGKKFLQAANWGPKTNTLIYIKENNIYFVPQVNEAMNAVQITNTGIPGVVYNGVSDWVYEEEVLSSGKAYWLSPSGDQLLYLTLNDTKVRKATLFNYGQPGSLQNQYPENVEIRYPKSGSTPPDFKLWHVALNDNFKQRLITLSEHNIFYGLKWADNDSFLYIVTNRVQNVSATYFCNLKSESFCSRKFEHVNERGWANTEMPLVSDNVDRFLKLEGRPVGNLGNFKHLVVYYADKREPLVLTKGHFDVIKVLHWDQKNKIVYYLAAEEYNSTTSQVFSVSEELKENAKCLSCGIKSPEGRMCKDASAEFSKLSNYLVMNCNGPDPRVVYLFENKFPLEKPLRTLENNLRIRRLLGEKLLPEVLNLVVEISPPFNADVRMFLPPNMDKSGRTKYPMVVFVYGGPASKGISDAFKLDWGLYMSTNLSVIYTWIDGRNTLKKGENMMFAGYRALGTYEIEDQINVTRKLHQLYPFIDSKNTGIWGWSYGGYATTKALETDVHDTFKCGIAVAPVTDWLYYDSIYTERYMGLPQENEVGYRTSSTLRDVSNLSKKKYFLIHGNADDNVHYQNAMMLARKLEKENIPFELMSYPDENHTLGTVRLHLYNTMSRFWKRCFNLSF